MDLFTVLDKLYTAQDCKWIIEIDEDSISQLQPMIIQRFLLFDDDLRVQTRWLDKYTFRLDTRMFLSLAWSIIPKVNRRPFIKYIKQLDKEEEMAFILDKIRKQFKLSDNDYKANKSRLINFIKKDTIAWFKYYGVEKTYWKKYYLDFNAIKGQSEEKKAASSLEAWGL